MAAHLVEYRALRRENVPVGLVRRMGAVEYLQCLIVVAGVGQRPAVSAEHGLVVRALDRGLLQDGDSLGPLSGSAQRLRIAYRGLDVSRIGAILLPVDVGVVVRVAARLIGRGHGQRAGRFGGLHGLAPGRCRRDDGNKRGRSEQAGRADGGDPSGRTHRDRCQYKAL